MSAATGPGSNEAFDYIVVGAGSGGAALAARLTENGKNAVLVLEAGGPDKNRAISIPAAFSQLFKSEYDWNYETTPQPELGGRTVYWPRGKVLGGSSSMNAMMWVRGFAADYDHWAELAGSAWSYDALKPLFQKVERTVSSNDPDHGTAGAVSIEPQRDPRSHTATFLKAVREAGYDVENANSAQPNGFSQTMVSQKKGVRSSTATAYLKPAMTRPNLTVRTNAQATRVLFEGHRAVGVEYRHDGVQRQVTARGEVILAGGAINTPQLLMLSGIGDARQLRAQGIEVLVDSPEVGRGLRDHLVSLLVVDAKGDTLFTATKLGQVGKYLTQHRGMLTSNVAEAYGFVRSDPAQALPDVELLFAPVAYVGEGLTGIPEHGITLGPILLQPKSHGTITLATANPFDKPIIDPKYLSDAGSEDRAVMLAGLAICETILSTPSFKAQSTGRFIVPDGGSQLDEATRDRNALIQYSHTLYHPTSTARMGTDSNSVVDPELKVRGVQGLRVADASIFPEIIRGHTNAPAIVVGEKAAALILAQQTDSA